MNLPDPTWRAACDGENPELWFSNHADDITEAKAICRTCPVREACAEYAIPNEEWGVWGGLDEDQRRRARRAAKKEQVA